MGKKMESGSFGWWLQGSHWHYICQTGVSMCGKVRPRAGQIRKTDNGELPNCPACLAKAAEELQAPPPPANSAVVSLNSWFQAHFSVAGTSEGETITLSRLDDGSAELVHFADDSDPVTVILSPEQIFQALRLLSVHKQLPADPAPAKKLVKRGGLVYHYGEGR
jgi:hypothetical protein